MALRLPTATRWLRRRSGECNQPAWLALHPCVPRWLVCYLQSVDLTSAKARITAIVDPLLPAERALRLAVKADR